MKLLFSEGTPDYSHYHYPYVIWGFLEPGEQPADAFAAGFMPGTPEMDRWYMVRQIRVPLREWRPTSENRRVLRKSQLRCALIPKSDFPDTPERRERWLSYAARKWGPGIMPSERLNALMTGPVITHLLHFTAHDSDLEFGTALLFCQPKRVAFYYYAFYELTPETKHLGMGMMTHAVQFFAEAGYEYVHVGTCYSESALYKAQFEPLEFWNGFRWSRDPRELRHLVRQSLPEGRHRLETSEFREFQPGDLASLARESSFHFTAAPPTSRS